MSHPSLFREYDIRGIVDETLFASDAHAIGFAFAHHAEEMLGRPATLCVGRDGRLSSPALEAALCEGLRAGGATVVRIGLGPTPMLYFSMHHLKADGGVMVTGSHNPPDHNGFKFMLGDAPFYGEAIQKLRARIARPRHSHAEGAQSDGAVNAAYVEKLRAAYKHTRDVKVAWDAGNGAAGEIMKALCALLPGTHITLNERIDGTFPAHHPDPTVPENLKQLIDTVRAQKCDLGIAFDGDGDRIGVVDDEGEILWADQLLILWARGVLQAIPGAAIIADVKTSQVFFDEVARSGGKAIMWKTGHSLVKAKMKETGAPLAGEMSGHIFFADTYYGFDDALYAAVRLLSILSATGEKLSDFRKSLPKLVNTPELRFACDDTRKFAVIDEVKQRLEAQEAAFIAIDGVRVNTPEGWWLLRASNTQAALVARCEAATQAGLAILQQQLRHELAASGVDLPTL